MDIRDTFTPVSVNWVQDEQFQNEMANGLDLQGDGIRKLGKFGGYDEEGTSGNNCCNDLQFCEAQLLLLEEEAEDLTDIVDSVSRNPNDSIMESQNSCLVISLYDQNLPSSEAYVLKEAVNRIDVYTFYSTSTNRNSLIWDRVLIAPWEAGDLTGPETQLLRNGVIVAGSTSTHPRVRTIDADTPGTVYEIQAKQRNNACVPCPVVNSPFSTVATITINELILFNVPHTASSGSISVAGSVTLDARQP